jgi:hypothetical protein
MDLNNHKADSREIGTGIDLRIAQIQHKLILKTSVLKTKLETTKVELTRDIVWYSCAFILGLIGLDFLIPNPKNHKAAYAPINTAYPISDMGQLAHTDVNGKPIVH